MSRTTLTVLAACAAAVIAGCSTSGEVASASGKGEACFWPRDVANWADARRGMLNIRTTEGEYFQARMMSPCPGIDFSQQMTLITRFSRRVCEGDDATLVIPDKLSGPDTCRVDQFRRMSAEEVAALAPTDKP